MHCEDEARALIHQDLDQELSDADRAALDRHLTACVSCARYRDALRETVEALESAPAVFPPDDFTNQVMARVRGTASDGCGAGFWLGRRGFVLGTASAVLAGYAVAVLLGWLGIGAVGAFAGDVIPALAGAAIAASDFVEINAATLYVYVPPGAMLFGANMAVVALMAWLLRHRLVPMYAYQRRAAPSD